ncbi:hypothetical protein EV421DRAFT_1901000 [Armillaria borealis]|uniref:Uncharacterized protein n=1 Tax=Armillaria borealis TaxID=47425 RepID=A0AA39MUK2_9AGAR|nr:hypothetical protein EV421DRAFT_1901000 [Armillaria borealis]
MGAVAYSDSVFFHEALSGLKGKTLKVYVADYQTGLDGKAKLEEFMGARGKGISSSPTKYMKLMGCIEALKAVKCDDDGRGNRFAKDNEKPIN